MCIAIPAKLIEKDGANGKVDYMGNVVPVQLGLVDAKIGDYLLIHAGCAISVLPDNEAEEMLQLFKELEEVL